MTRSDADSWDVASSVGATATMVAAARALASREPNPLIDDPFAAPLVRAVGIDFFTRLLDGDIDLSASDDEQHRAADDHRDGGAHEVLRRLLHRRNCRRHPAGGDPGFRVWTRAPTGCRGRTGTIVYEIDQPKVIEFKTTTMTAIGATPTAERRAVSHRPARGLADRLAPQRI